MGSDTQRDEVEREVKTVLFSATLVETPFMLQKHDDVSSASGWNSILVSAPNTDAEDRKFTSFPTEEGGRRILITVKEVSVTRSPSWVGS